MRRTVHWIRGYAARPWYLPLVAFLSALDAYVVFVPNEALLVPAVMTRRNHWLRTAIWVTLGSALGAASMAWVIGTNGDRIVEWLFPGLTGTEDWHRSIELIRKHGPWGLALISLSPLPQHAGVIIAAFAGMKDWVIFLAVFAGRLLKYVGLAWATVKAPWLLRKLHVPLDDSDEAGLEKKPAR